MARLCKIYELYDFKCGDYLLWYETRKDDLIPCIVYSPVDHQYIFSPDPKYFYVNGWKPIATYNKKWRIWERKPTPNERLMEAWDDEE